MYEIFGNIDKVSLNEIFGNVVFAVDVVNVVFAVDVV